MIKLIATDLDGTLMSPDHMTITSRTVNTLLEAHNRGIKIAIATGRPLAIIGDVVEQIPFTDYIIYSNGACVFDRRLNKNIYEDLIPNCVAREIIDFFLKYPVFFEVYIKGIAHYQFGTEEYFTSDEMPQEFLDTVIGSMIGHKDIFDAIGDQAVEKVTLYSVKEEFVAEFSDMLKQHNLSVASSFKDNLETTTLSANKGEAVNRICQSLGITADNAMAFGDAGNDCDMLKFAKYSFAMANATQECKDAAEYVTLSNAEDGLAVAVEKFALNRK